MRQEDNPREAPIVYTPPSRLSRATVVIGFVIFGLALLARAACLRQLQASPLVEELSAGAASPVEWAKRLTAGDWTGSGLFDQGPLYAYFLGIVFSFFGPGLLAPRLIQVVIGAASCVLIHRIGRQAFSHATGTVAGLAAALYAPLILQDVQISSEIFAVLLICAVVYQLLAADGSQRGLLASAGICLALAALVRDALILLAPVVALWLMIDPWVRGKMTAGRSREGLGRVGAFAVGLLMVMTPVAVRNYHVASVPLPLTKASTQLFRSGADAGAQLVRAGGEAGAQLAHSSGDSASVTPTIGVFFNHRELPDPATYERHRSLLPILRFLPDWGWLAPAAFAGIVLSLLRWRESLLLYLVGGGYLAATLLLSTGPYRMPLVPLMLLFAAHGLIEIVTALPRGRFLRAAVGALAFLAGIALVNLSF